jgi:hypothetical protein
VRTNTGDRSTLILDLPTSVPHSLDTSDKLATLPEASNPFNLLLVALSPLANPTPVPRPSRTQAKQSSPPRYDETYTTTKVKT